MEIKYTIQGLLIYITIAAYAVGFLLAIFRIRKPASVVYFLGFLASIAAFVYRWIHVQHVPMQNLFEVFLTLGMVIWPLSLFSRKVLRISAGPGDSGDMLMGLIVLFPAAFLKKFSADPQMLPPALQCWLFAPHVAVYMLSYMMMAKANYLAFGRILKELKYSLPVRFFLSLTATIFSYLIALPITLKFSEDPHFQILRIKDLALKIHTIPLVTAILTGICVFIFVKLLIAVLQFLTRVFYVKSEDLGDLLPYEDATYLMVKIGFPFLTLGLILGSWWGKLAWGDYWGWDPKELWSLVSWLVFLGYFHFRALYGKKYSRTNSVLAILGMVAIIITLLWANLSRLFEGMHSYA